MRGRSKNTFSSDINFKISVSLNALLLVFLFRTAITFMQLHFLIRVLF